MLPSPKDDLILPVKNFINHTLLAPLAWSDFSELFNHYLVRRQKVASSSIDLFPTLTCLAAGGRSENAIQVTAAWLLFVLSARMFDDLADEQKLAREWAHLDRVSMMSMALFAQGAANIALAMLPSGYACKEISLAFNQALAMAAKAQQQETQNQEFSIEQDLGVIATKTGFIFAVGAWAGGIVAAESPCPTTVKALHTFGLNVGIMDQLVDDCQDLAADLAKGIWTLPVFYAISQATKEESTHLRKFLGAAKGGDEEAVETAVAQISAYDAIPWCLTVVAAYQQRALEAIQTLSSQNRSYLINYAKRNNIESII